MFAGSSALGTGSQTKTEGRTIKWAGDREGPTLIYFLRESMGWIGLPQSQGAQGDVIRRTESLQGGQGAPPRSWPPPEPL